jgi:signal transduction histidine kinase
MEIIDTGVGIKKENLGKLFMDFSRLDEHQSMNAQGTGLGLSICKRMLEQMGGTVKVDSTEGKGTTFTIEISTKAQIKENELKKVKSESHKSLDNLLRSSSLSSGDL